MPRSSDPFAKINWQTTPPLHELQVAVSEHFSDARSGQPLATNELVEDCMIAFKALGIVPTTITQVMNSVYGLSPMSKPVQEAPKQPEAVAVSPEKKGGIFNR